MCVRVCVSLSLSMCMCMHVMPFSYFSFLQKIKTILKRKYNEFYDLAEVSILIRHDYIVDSIDIIRGDSN